MSKLRTRVGGLLVGATLLLAPTIGIPDADARGELRTTTTSTLVVVEQQTVAFGPSAFAARDTQSLAKKYCDDDPVDDDIVDCDIGEIAWTCPDDHGDSYEGCDGNTDGTFDD